MMPVHVINRKAHILRKIPIKTLRIHKSQRKHPTKGAYLVGTYNIGTPLKSPHKIMTNLLLNLGYVTTKDYFTNF